VLYDINAERIQMCRENKPHIYEQGLEEVLKKTNGTNLTMTDKLEEALKQASVIFLALPTPTKNFGQNQGKAYDLSYNEIAFRSIIKYYN
jgi:UDPglucose 6-dehydrogenase